MYVHHNAVLDALVPAQYFHHRKAPPAQVAVGYATMCKWSFPLVVLRENTIATRSGPASEDITAENEIILLPISVLSQTRCALVIRTDWH